jgi:predicted DNA-binding protein (MmcQ/YjbR family)
LSLEEFRDYCLRKPGTTEELPFGPDTLVFKVMGKLFALTDIEVFESINLKCDPALAIELREKYDGKVIPGYHMNKKHWNTVIVDGSIPDSKIKHWINHSYELVVAGLPKKVRDQLRDLTGKIQ